MCNNNMWALRLEYCIFAIFGSYLAISFYFKLDFYNILKTYDFMSIFQTQTLKIQKSTVNIELKYIFILLSHFDISNLLFNEFCW